MPREVPNPQAEAPSPGVNRVGPTWGPGGSQDNAQGPGINGVGLNPRPGERQVEARSNQRGIKPVGPTPGINQRGINQALSEDLILSILEAVSLRSGRFKHALVCRKWAALSPQSQLLVKVRDSAKLTWQQLAAVVEGFPNLRSLKLGEASMKELSDPVLENLGPYLKGLHQIESEGYCSWTRPTVTSAGLSALFLSCPLLRYCAVSFSHQCTLPDTVTTLRSLRFLECKNMDALPDNLGALTSLKELALWNEKLFAVPASVFSLGCLTKLSINLFEVQSIPGEIGALTTLLNLEIFSSQITSLPPELFRLTQLKRLHLRCNLLQEIPDSVGKLKNLEALEVPACSSVEALPRSVLRLTRLRVLEGGHMISPLPGGLSGFSNLHTLRLSFLEDGDTFPAGLGTLKHSLKSLAFECCGLLKALPEAVTELENLESLAVDFCIELQELSAGLGRLRRLRRLELSGLPKLASLPESIGQLLGLEQLVMSSLDSLARIPDGALRLPRLTRVAITTCPLLPLSRKRTRNR